MNNDAIYFPNLLQLAIRLKNADSEYFNQINTYKYGNSPEHVEDINMIGFEQAFEFLNELYQSKYFADEEFLAHFKFNPLIKKLGIKEDIYNSISKPNLSVSAIPEGLKMPADGVYLEFNTSAIFMSQVIDGMDRIINRQSFIAKDTKRYTSIADHYEEQTGGRPQFINMGSIKQYNATLSSYFARARYLGGVERYLDKSLIELSEKAYKDKYIKAGWHLKSQEIISSIFNKRNNDELLKITKKANELLEGGIFFLKREQYINSSLLSFVFDGEIENTISISGISDNFNYFDNKASDEKIIDSHYQSIFNINILNTKGVYGIKGKRTCVLESSSRNNIVSTFRVKRNEVPQIIVDSIDELKDVIDVISKQFPDKNVYYRGQAKHHKLNRPDSINEFLYGDANVNELSLPTAASRNNFDFDTFNSAFQMHIQGMMYSKIEKEKFDELHSEWKFWSHTPPTSNDEINEIYEKWYKLFHSYEWDLMVMALAQHYGVPTHGLDITTDLNVALWFATNQWYSYEYKGKKYAWYKELARNYKKDINDYPVIYIVSTDNSLKRDLDQVEFAGFKALRPKRQGAFLHFGGWGLHSNICAEEVVAAIHLSKNVEISNLPKAEELFPSPEEDDFYKDLLTLKYDAINSGFKTGFEDIVEYRKE